MLPRLHSARGASSARRTAPPTPRPAAGCAHAHSARPGGRAPGSAAAHSSSFATALLDGRGGRPLLPRRRCRGNRERVGWVKVRRRPSGGRRAGALRTEGPARGAGRGLSAAGDSLPESLAGRSEGPRASPGPTRARLGREEELGCREEQLSSSSCTCSPSYFSRFVLSGNVHATSPGWRCRGASDPSLPEEPRPPAGSLGLGAGRRALRETSAGSVKEECRPGWARKLTGWCAVLCCSCICRGASTSPW